MRISIDRASGIPLYRQVSEGLKALILTGELRDGHRLPPERHLAHDLGVNRSTILAAYDELKALGLIEARVGRGTSVTVRHRLEETPEIIAPPSWQHLLRRTARVQDPLIRDLLALTKRTDLISMSVGVPAPDLLPLDSLRQTQERLTARLGSACLLHSPTEGIAELRETLAMLMAQRGIQCTPEETMVTSGSQQGIDLIARLFVEPGDTVIVEEPTFFGALQVFRAAQARLVGIPVDHDGMNTEALALVLQHHHPKLIYTVPTFHNPTGTVLSLRRREQLLELAYRHQIPIVEDDPYSDLRYDGEPVPLLKAMDRHGYVMYLSSFSKILFPGLRIGWLAAPEPLTRQVALAKQAADLHSSTLGQWIMDHFIRDGHLQRHLDRVKEAYRQRRDTLDHALRGLSARDVTWDLPEGGFYIWCRVPPEIAPNSLLSCAAKRGVSFLPGAACFTVEPSEHFIRLTFCFPTAEQIRSGIEAFATALSEARAVSPARDLKRTGTPPIV